MPGPKETTMWKVLTFLRRNPVMTPDEFVRYWHDVHAPLMQQQEDFWRHVRKYVQNSTLEPEAHVDGPDAYDGVSELWFDSADELRAAFDEPGFAIVREDAKNFVALSGSMSWAAEVVPIKDPGPTAIKIFAAGRVKEGLAREEAQEYWRDEHSRLAEREAPVLWSMIPRSVQNHTRHVEGLALETLTDKYDFAAEVGCDSVEAMQDAFARPEYMEIIRPDELRFASADDTLRVVTREALLSESI